MMGPFETPADRRRFLLKDILTLTVFLAVIYGFNLGGHPLVNPDEARYAEIPREMVESGDYVTPRLNGVKYFDKPPLLYWLGTVSYRVTGAYEGGFRFWPALFSITCCLGLYVVGRRVFGRGEAFAGAVVLGTTLLTFVMGRVLTLDIAVSSLMSLSLFCFLGGIQEALGGARRGWFLGVYAFAALATLAKGMIGFVLPGGVFFFWALLGNRWKRLWPIYPFTGIPLFLLIALPWHILVHRANPDWFQHYVVHEHFLRFTTEVHEHDQPFWFFLPIVMAGLFPWTSFLVPALRRPLETLRTRGGDTGSYWFLITWAVFILAFFSMSGSKLIPYVLPVLPPLALLIGVHLARVWKSGELQLAKKSLWVHVAVSLLVMAAAVIAILDRPPQVREAVGLPAGIGFGMVAVSLVAIGVFGKRKRVRPVLVSMFVGTLGLLGAVAFIVPIVQHPSAKPLAAAYREQFPDLPLVYCYHYFFGDFTFYSKKLVGTVDYKGDLWFGIAAEDHADRFITAETFRQRWNSPETVLSIMEKYELDGLAEDEDFLFFVVAETPRHVLITNRSSGG